LEKWIVARAIKAAMRAKKAARRIGHFSAGGGLCVRSTMGFAGVNHMTDSDSPEECHLVFLARLYEGR